MREVLIIGPIPEPTTGVSLANKVVLDYLNKEKDFNATFINTSYTKFDENLGVFSFAKLFFYLKLNLSSYKIFKTDIVYITPGQTFFGVLKYALFIGLTKLLGKELIVHVHGNHIGTEYSLLKGIKKKVFGYLLRKSSKGIVLSESLKGNMQPFISENKIYVLYNFVEDYLFSHEKGIENQLMNNTPRIIFLSNLMEEKGIFDLLEALVMLEEKGIVYEARIAGNIDDKHKKKTEIYFNKLKNTKYVGVVKGDNKKSLLLWGNVFVLATYYSMEGQPISILEAMATRNLILTTKHAGIPDIFADSVNGYFVEKKAPESIVKKIIELNQNIEKSNEIRLINYETAKEKYRVENFISKITEIFKA